MVLAEGDISTSTMGILMFISNAVSGVMVFLLTQWSSNKKTNRENKVQDDTTLFSRMQQVIDRQEVDRQAAVDREDKCQEALSSVKTELGRAVEWIRHYEFHMKSKNVEYRSWKDTPAPSGLEVRKE